jgi:hypothetical protein
MPAQTVRRAEKEAAGSRGEAETRRLPDSPIEVNIGRIEVRAILPTAQPTAQARPRADSALSLADYLKQRDRGER